ncbi:MAG TPA: alpha/beta-type small acid-soluble spore protein [Firmicutes bacterium]|nr:alpha/beta-type small acid-soluble spore protein [Bacillota bacterium]
MSKNSIPAHRALHKFKYELAAELGTNYEYKTGYWGNVAAREHISEGGPLMRGLLASAELRAARDITLPS